MKLVERGAQPAVLRRLFEECAAGGEVAVLCGPVTSGKTELLRQFEDEAERARALVPRMIDSISAEHYAQGDSKRSRAVAHRAIQVAKLCDAEEAGRRLLLADNRSGWSESIEDIGAAGGSGLTDAERRIASLAAGT